MEASRLPRILDRTALFLVAFQVVLRFCVSSGTGLGLFINALLWTAAAVWLAGRLLEGRWTLRLTGTEIPLAAFLILSVLSVWRASYQYRAIETAASFATLALLVPLCANLFAGRRALLARLLIASLVALSVYAFLQRFWILPELDARYAAEKTELTRNMLDRLQSGEIWATFFYPNSFACFLAIILPVAAGAFIDTKDWRVRGVCGAAIVLGGLSLLFTGSKGAWIAIAAAVVLYRALLAGRRAVFFAVAAIALVAAVAVGPRIMRQDSMQTRSVYWSAALGIAKDHPVLGVGADNFEEYYYQYRDDRQQEVQRAHNDYLQVLAELGVLGLLAYLAFLALTVRSALKAEDEPPPEPDRVSVRTVGAGIGAAVLAAAAAGGIFRDVLPGVVVPLVMIVWVGTFAAARVTFGRATRLGLVAGLAAGCVHSLVDFNLYAPGTAATLFLAAALPLAARPVELGRFSTAAAAAGAVIATALLALPAQGILDAEQAREQRRFEEAVLLNPLDAEAWSALADAKAEHGDRALAHAALDQALVRRPRYSPYHDRKAQLYEQEGRLEEARQSYERSVEFYPNRAPGQFHLAHILDRLGRKDEAFPHYRRALELESLATLNQMHLKLTREQREEAQARAR